MASRFTLRKEKIVLGLLLAGLTIAVFWQVRHHDFINLDDELYVSQNPHVRAGVTVRGILWAFTTTYADFWHPLTWLSHMLDWQLYGAWAGGHHLSSVILHAANTVILFLLLSGMTGAVRRSAFVAALFALHPLHVESVVWAAERKDVLSAFFFLLSLLAYLGYVRRPGWPYGLAVLAFFLLSLMSKPTFVTLPLVLLLLDFWPLGRMAMLQRRDPAALSKKKKASKTIEKEPPGGRRVVKRLFWEKSPLFALSLIFGILAIAVQGRAEGSLFRDWPLWVRASNACISTVAYLGQTIWPIGLAPFYPHPGLDVSIGKALLAGTFLTAASAAALYFARRYSYLATGWFWYLITLAPVSGIIQVGKHAMADRYTYVPLIGLFIIIAWGACDLAQRSRHRGLLLAPAAGLVLLALIVLSWQQVSRWQNSVVLFEHTLRVTEGNYLAHTNLGVALSRMGRSEEAADHYREAIRINPNFSSTHYNLANYYAARRMQDDAERHYREAIRIRPGYAGAHNNLGILLASQGRFAEAASHCEKALRIEPSNAGFHYNYGIVLANQSRLEDAAQHFRAALALRPNYAEAHNDLGRVLVLQGRKTEGAFHFREALRIKPNFTEARRSLDLLQGQQKRQ